MNCHLAVECFRREFKNTFKQCGVRDDRFLDTLLDPLVAAYLESWRSYHNVSHIIGNHAYIMRFADHAQDVRKVRLANFYHDAIYEIGASDNETRSGEWAVRDLTACKVFSPRFIEDVYRHTVGTDHKRKLIVNDDQFMADVDLAGLGSPWEIYQQDGKNVRKEYASISDEAWRKGRPELFLEPMLRRRYIYYLKPFRDVFEKQARENLERELKELTGREM